MPSFSNLGVVVVAPFWSQSDNMNVDSNYTYLRSVLPEMERQCPNTLFLMLFPDPTHGADSWRYTPDGLQSDHIKFIKWPYDTAMLSSITSWPVLRFKQIDTDYGVTLYWLNQIEMGANAVHGYHKVFNHSSQPALVGQQHYILHRSLPYVYETQFSRLWLQMGGALSCDKVVYHTNYALGMAKESYAEWLAPPALQIIKDKAIVLLEGVIFQDDPVAPEAAPDAPPIFIYNHRFESYKNPKDTFDLFESLRLTYPKISVWATQVAGQHTRKWRYDKIVYAPKRYDYLANIAVPAINTLNTLHETMCLSIVDSLTLGHVCVLPNAVTFPELVPKGYPYLFNSLQEQRDMVRSILDTWPNEYNHWRSILASHARSQFDAPSYVTKYLQIMFDAENMHRGTEKKETTLATIRKVFKGMKLNKPYVLKEVTLELRKQGGLAHQSMPFRRAVREAMEFGGIEISWNNGVVLTRVE